MVCPPAWWWRGRTWHAAWPPSWIWAVVVTSPRGRRRGEGKAWPQPAGRWRARRAAPTSGTPPAPPTWRLKGLSHELGDSVILDLRILVWIKVWTRNTALLNNHGNGQCTLYTVPVVGAHSWLGENSGRVPHSRTAPQDGWTGILAFTKFIQVTKT